jgi:hypothetical protein
MSGPDRSRFWRRVEGLGAGPGPARVDGPLERAVGVVYRRQDRAVAFRRNRELGDIAGQFRWFEAEDAAWVVKVLSQHTASAEVAAAHEVNARLERAGVAVRAAAHRLVDIGGGDAAVVMPDLGRTLAEEMVQSSASLPAILEELLGQLLQAGLVWHGLAPRNVFATSRGYVLVDLDGVSPRGVGPVNRRDVEFWALDWCPLGGSVAQTAHVIGRTLDRFGLATAWPAPDSYEEMVGRLTGRADAQAATAEFTRIAWHPLTVADHGELDLSPSESCRLLDDVLPTTDSARASVALAARRRRDGDACYAEILAQVQEILVAELRGLGASDSLAIDRDRLADRVRLALAATVFHGLTI